MPPPQPNDVKRLAMIAGGVVLLLTSSLGLFWALGGKQRWTKETGIQNQVTYTAGGDGVPQIIVNEDTGPVEVLSGGDESGAAADGVVMIETTDPSAEKQSENSLPGGDSLDGDATPTSTAQCVKVSATEATEGESQTQDKTACTDDEAALSGENADTDAPAPPTEANGEAQPSSSDAEPVLLDFADGEESTSATGWWKKSW